MHDFEFFNPTKIIYGVNKVKNVGEYVNAYTKTKKILLVISESCKRNGLLQIVIDSLNQNNITFYIVDEIVPNPTLECVYKGKKICKEHEIDFILAIGGASVVDTAKSISVASYNEDDIWNLVCNPSLIKGAIPLGTIITLYGSGTEMTNGAVISNVEIPKKRGFDSIYMYPKFSILDPTTLESCSQEHLMIGMTDMFTHILEDYFEITDEYNLADDFQKLLVKDMIVEFEKANKGLQDNNKLLWMSTLAQNKFLSFGKKYNGEWVAHIIAHEFCVKYNFPHGKVVAILFVSWLNFIKEENKKRIIDFGKDVFGLEMPTVDDVIIEIKKIYKLLGNVLLFKELGVKQEDIDEIVENAMLGKKLGKYKLLDKNDVKNIIVGGYYENNTK